MVATHLDIDPVGPDPGASTSTSRRLRPGARVEVRRRLDDKWARGFELVEDLGDQDSRGNHDDHDRRYRVRRLSDGVELPTTFAPSDVRRERQRDTWWY